MHRLYCNKTERKRGMTGAMPKDRFDDETVQGKLPDTKEVSVFEQICLDTIINQYAKKDIRRHEVLYMFFVSGYTHPEIATMMNITEKTSRNIVYEEIKRVRKVFK